MFEGIKNKINKIKKGKEKKEKMKLELMKVRTKALKHKNKITKDYNNQRKQYAKLKNEERERKLAPLRKAGASIRGVLRDPNVKALGNRSRSMFQTDGKSKSLFDTAEDKLKPKKTKSKSITIKIN